MHLSGTEVAKAIDDAVAEGVAEAQTTVYPTTASKTGAYTLAATDAGGTVLFSGATTAAPPVPQDSAADLPIGTYVRIVTAGSGKITLTAGTGATLQSGAAGEILDTHAVAEVVQVAANTWQSFGGLAAS